MHKSCGRSVRFQQVSKMTLANHTGGGKSLWLRQNSTSRSPRVRVCSTVQLDIAPYLRCFCHGVWSRQASDKLPAKAAALRCAFPTVRIYIHLSPKRKRCANQRAGRKEANEVRCRYIWCCLGWGTTMILRGETLFETGVTLVW